MIDPYKISGSGVSEINSKGKVIDKTKEEELKEKETKELLNDNNFL